MEWFYVNRGQQVGPVSQAEFERLVSGGTIGAETLVWRQGMAQWQAYSTAAGGTAAGASTGGASAGGASAGGAGAAGSPQPGADAAVAPGDAVCSECGRVLPADDLVSIAGRRVCAACKPAYLQRVREGSVRAGLAYGGFWIRFGARIIDSIILWVVNTLIAVPVMIRVFFTTAGSAPGDEPSAAMLGTQMILAFIQLVVAAAYETFFIGRFAATPGKMVCRLKVVRPDGGRVSYARSLGRYCGTFLSALILGIGYLIAAFDVEKRTLHDRICDTRVIRG